MAITIKRNTGWIGGATDLQIRLNGEKAAKVMENQTVEVEFPGNKAYIKATQFGTKSNEIEVKDGDILEITTKRWRKMSFYIIIVAFVLTSFILDPTYRIAVFIPLLVLSTISTFLIDGFYIKVIPSS